MASLAAIVALVVIAVSWLITDGPEPPQEPLSKVRRNGKRKFVPVNGRPLGSTDLSGRWVTFLAHNDVCLSLVTSISSFIHGP